MAAINGSCFMWCFKNPVWCSEYASTGFIQTVYGSDGQMAIEDQATELATVQLRVLIECVMAMLLKSKLGLL